MALPYLEGVSARGETYPLFRRRITMRGALCAMTRKPGATCPKPTMRVYAIFIVFRWIPKCSIVFVQRSEMGAPDIRLGPAGHE
jgi:hypothetical protein